MTPTRSPAATVRSTAWSASKSSYATRRCTLRIAYSLNEWMRSRGIRYPSVTFSRRIAVVTPFSAPVRHVVAAVAEVDPAGHEHADRQRDRSEDELGPRDHAVVDRRPERLDQVVHRVRPEREAVAGR